jgi:hypothetical protein
MIASCLFIPQRAVDAHNQRGRTIKGVAKAEERSLRLCPWLNKPGAAFDVPYLRSEASEKPDAFCVCGLTRGGGGWKLESLIAWTKSILLCAGLTRLPARADF